MLPVYYKRYNSETARWMMYIGQGMRKGHSSILSEHTIISESPHVQQLRSPPNTIILGFTEASLHICGWSNHWLLVIEINLQALSPTQKSRGWDWNLQASDHMVAFLGNKPPYLRAFQMSLHQQNKRHLLHSHHLGNSEGFRISVPEQGLGPNIYIFLINHNITTTK